MKICRSPECGKGEKERREGERDRERVLFIKAVSMHTNTLCIASIIYCIIDLDDMLDGNEKRMNE